MPEAQAAFLTAAADERLHADARAAPDVDGADTLGAVDLVPGDGEQVDLHVLDVDRDLTHGLRGVGVEEHLVRAADLANLLQRLDDADLVVHRHHRHHRRLRTDRGAQLVEIDEAVGLDREVRHVPSLLLEVAARVQHALVVRLRRDDVGLAPLVKVAHALDGHVVGLGGAAGEDDLLGVGSDDGRDVRACLLDGVLGFPAVHVRAAVRVSVLLDEVGQHRVENAGIYRGGGLHVEVERAAPQDDALHLDGLVLGGRGLGGEPAGPGSGRTRTAVEGVTARASRDRGARHRRRRRRRRRRAAGSPDGRAGGGERAGAGCERAPGDAAGVPREGADGAHAPRVFAVERDSRGGRV